MVFVSPPMNSVIDTTAAAPPPTPLKAATIWGMAVIFTFRAAGTPMAVPMTTATTSPATVAPAPS